MRNGLHQVAAGLAALLTLAATSGPVAAATPMYRLPLSGALSQNTVSDILQDRRGQMWFATLGGLNVYDGYTFHTVSSDPRGENSLAGVHIQSLHEDREGMIWVAGFQGWLDRIDPATGRITHYPDMLYGEAGRPQTGATAFLEAGDGTLWLGTARGLFRYQRASDHFEPFALPPDLQGLRVTALAHGGNGSLWLGSTRGLHWLAPKSGDFRSYRHDTTNDRSLPANVVTAIATDSAGRTWVGTNSGLARLLEDRSGFRVYAHDSRDPVTPGSNTIVTVYADAGGVVWVGTQSGGLARYEPANDTFRRYLNDPDDPDSINNNDVWSIFRDRSGLLWIGTAGGGLNQLNPSRHRFNVLRAIPFNANSLRHSFVWDMDAEAGGALWLATLGGLERFDPASGRLQHFDTLPGDLAANQVQSVQLSGDGAVWIGTVDGHLFRFDPRTGSLRNITRPGGPGDRFDAGRIWYLGDAGDGWLYAAIGPGIFRINTRNATSERFLAPRDEAPMGGNPVRVSFIDSEGLHWFGGGGAGLMRYGPQTDEWTFFRHDDADRQSLSHDVVRCIYEDADGGLWVGTHNGLNYLAPEDRAQGRGSFRLYTTADGLPNNTIYDIQPGNDGALWLSTNAGLSRFDTASSRFTNFSVADGLLSNEFNGGAAYASADGTLYFGGVGGLTYFKPDELPQNTYIPDVVITHAEVRQESLSPVGVLPTARRLELPWNRNDIRLEFAVTDYHQPEKNTFRYRLLGLDSHWTSTRRNAVSYSALPPGNYRLEVTGSNNDGQWSAAPAIMEISLRPPWWRSDIAYTAYVLLILGIALVYHLAQTRRLRRERDFSEQLSRANSLAEANHKLALHHAKFDRVTQLPNRTSLLEALARYMRFAREHERTLAVTVLNLDRFQRINDTLGHALGDRMLRVVGERLLAVVSDEDYLAHIGGDEFAVLKTFPDTDGSPGRLQDLIDAMSAVLREPLDFGDPPIRVGGSFGSVIHAGGVETPSDLLSHADLAMHVAKREGAEWRNYQPEMSHSLRERLGIETRILRALQDGEFRACYQPLVDARTRKLLGCEALIRWHPPNLPQVFPDQFIPVAEESGLIIAIGDWMIDETCRQLALWDARLPAEFKLAVNVSMKQLSNGQLVSTLETALRRHHVPARRLKVEITESAMMENVSETAEQLASVKALGVEVSVDDFGTGFSSLGHLKQLPVDELKIDRSFVSDIESSEQSLRIVGSIVRLAHELRLRVVAEGVENEASLRLLRRCGCDIAQGYYFSRPVPADDFEREWLESESQVTAS